MIGALIRATGVVKLESLVEPLKHRFGRLAERNVEAMKKAYEQTLLKWLYGRLGYYCRTVAGEPKLAITFWIRYKHLLQSRDKLLLLEEELGNCRERSWLVD